MITAVIWLVWASIGWAFDSVVKSERDDPARFVRLIGIPLCWTAAAVMATIVVNR